jgi:hypothetical protein
LCEAHELVLRRCIYEVRELVLRHGGRDLAQHHRDESGLVLHLYKNVVDDLLVHHRDGHVARELVLRRCIYEVRVLDVHLRSDCV